MCVYIYTHKINSNGAYVAVRIGIVLNASKLTKCILLFQPMSTNYSKIKLKTSTFLPVASSIIQKFRYEQAHVYDKGRIESLRQLTHSESDKQTRFSDGGVPN